MDTKLRRFLAIHGEILVLMNGSKLLLSEKSEGHPVGVNG
jgi:hypothetical protein